MRLGVISSFPPKHCGIAEFNHDLLAELLPLLPEPELVSIAVNKDNRLVNDYPADVKLQIRKNVLADYSRAADFINQAKPDVVLLQHEFGLFGGRRGQYALELIKNIKRPVICVLHTIPIRADARHTMAKKSFFLRANAHVEKFIVITPEGKNKLVAFGISPAKIQVIGHGAPNILAWNRPRLRQKLGLPEKSFLVLFFGLIHHSKGVEYAILAMKTVAKKRLNCRLLINCDPLEGEENEKYLIYLQSLIEKFNLSKNVFLRQEFLPREKLYEYINAVDIGILPYVHKSYISSGVLSFFVAAAKPVVTTTFAYATSLLSVKQTVFVPFRSSRAIAQAIERYMTDKKYYQSVKTNLLKSARSILWENKAKEYLRVFKEVLVNV